MTATPELLFRRQPVFDTEDLALSFLEEEVGRFDWLNNWKTVKESGTARQRVADWLRIVEIDHDPDAIVSYLDHLAGTRTGRWR